EGTNSLGVDSDGSNGWSFTWNAVPQGNYVLTAVATDNDLATTTSSGVNIGVSDPVNVAPTVAITSPLDNDSFTAPADIVITADASDTDGSVISVEFFEGTNSLGVDSDGSNGWSFTWNAVPQGAYVLTAVATDNAQSTTTSSVVNISVDALPAITNFIPSSGPVGSLVMINGTNLEDVYDVSFGPVSAEIVSTSATKLEVRVPYVNGKLPKDVKITLTAPTGQYTSFNKFTVTSGTAPVNAAPIVGIISPANNTTYSAPATIDILVNASDSDGVVTKVEFFNGNTKLGEDLSSPYEYQWSNVTAGNYSLSAIATDDKGDTGTSETVNIQVSDPGGNLAPEVSITSPVNNESFTAPADVTIKANAFDTDGSITKVEFFNGTTSLGIDALSPYEYSWNNVPSGAYSLTAIATDDKGAISTSGVVSITVSPSLSIAAPTNLTAQWVSNSAIDLSWEDNHTGEDGFVLERSSKSTFSGRLDYISLPSNSVSYQDTNLNSKKGGGILYYRIKAVKGNLSSEYSNVALATGVTTNLISSTEFVNTDALGQESFLAYPNPTSGEATFEFLFLESRSYSLRLYDSGGGFISILQEGKAEAGVKYQYSFDGSGLSDGLYLIHLETSKSLKTIKLLIER
ncbi:MAG: Ig-like domain-containing protein, partial [Candidatus Bathyarchaeota archaeon]|nr:Ig-like domain-containing protein [Candidatus Bathyarchaeota archaeon]